MLYQIGEFSKITKMSIRTLRYYQEIGLLLPSEINKESSYRYYDENCIEKANIINELKNLNFSLEEIKSILDNSGSIDINDYLKNKIKEIDLKLNELNSVKNNIEAFITIGKSEIKYHNTDVLYKEIKSMSIASYRFIGRYDEIGKYLNLLYKEYGRFITDSPFSLYYDSDSKTEDADIEVCVPLKVGVKGNNIHELEGGKVYSIIHYGSYDTLYKTYKKLVDYFKENNLIIDYPIRENYIKGKDLGLNNKEKLITEIYFPIKNKN